MAGAGTVWVDVRADTTGFLGDIRKAVSGLEGGRGVLLGAAAGTAAVGAGLGLIATKAVDASTEFNKSMSAVAATANATASELDTLSRAALDAGASTSFSASEAATAEAELARAGLSVADIISGGLSGALDLAAAGQLDLADAAITTAQALNTFNLEGDQASRVADVLAAGANKSAADVGSLSLALSQGGLVAKQTGLSLEETVGVLSLFADNALVGSDAGTSLKTALQRLVPQSTEAKQAMDDLGLSFFDAQGRFVGIEETAQRLQNALSSLSTEQRQAALNTIFGSDAIRAVGLLYEAGASGVKEYTDAVNDQGAAQRTAAIMLDNLAGDLGALSSAWDNFLIGIGDKADGGLRDLVQGLTGVVNDLGAALSNGDFDEFFARVEQIGGVLSDVLAAGWDVARVAFDGAASAADVLLPLVGGLADGLSVLADQAWLVQGALAAWSASKIVSFIQPFGESIMGAGKAAKYLFDSIDSIAATQGVGRLEALKGVIGSSASEGLTGALTAANVATVGLTAAVAGGLYLYQNWAQDTGRVADETDRLTKALQGASDLSTTEQLAKAFTQILDTRGDTEDGFAAAWAKTGLAISDVTAIINQNAGDFDKFRAAWQAAGEDVDNFTSNTNFARNGLERIPQSIRPFVETLFSLNEAGAITDHELRQVINAITDLDQEAQGAGRGLKAQAERFEAEAKGAKLSADAQRDLKAALADNTDLDDRREALSALIKAYPKVAEAAGISADTIDADTKSKADNTDATNTNADAQVNLADGYKVMSDAAREALDDVLGFFDAQDGYESAIEDQAKARKKLADIEAGASEGLTSARRALIDADKALTDAIEQQAEDIADAERKVLDAKDRLAEALEKGGAVGSGGVEGARVKPDFSVAREIGAAQRDLAAAERDLNDLRVNGSDSYRNALERQRDAQAKVNDEAAKVGPQSEAAADARDELERANRRVIDAELALSDAMGKVSKEDIPKAIEGLQSLGDKHAETKGLIDEQIGSLLALYAIYQALPSAGDPAQVPVTFGRVGTGNYPQRPQGNRNLGRAAGGPVWADSVHPVVERGLPEMFTDQRGNSFLLPPNGGGVVAPLNAGGSADLIAALDRVAGQLVQLNARPNEVRIDSINQYGVRDGSPSEMSRALADAGFAAR